MTDTSRGPVLTPDAQRQAAILLANMIEAYLDYHDPLPRKESFDESPENHNTTPTEKSLWLIA